MHGMYLENPVLPARLGYEAAGAVDAVGEGVDKALLGKIVATVPGFSMNQYGVLGEQAVVPARVLGEYPDSLSVVQAAASWMQYVTAYGALIHIAKLRAGDFVVVTAASSSVGLAALQIIKAEGGISIATTRDGTKTAELRAFGADHVIASDNEDLVTRVKEITGGKGARIIFDPVAGPFIEKLAMAAAYNGILIEYGALSSEPTPLPLFAALRSGLTIRGYTLMELQKDQALLGAAKKYVYDRLKDGRFVPKIARMFTLDRIKEAFEYMESNVQVGKIVVTV
jgi:NADPH:quinone reductase-like Zn-dependent oxidoreductase